jgi:RNA polymerase sigma factor (sigma-70 family)
MPTRATSPAADLRLELRARNNVLWHVVYDAAPSLAEFCRRHDLGLGPVCDVLNLKASPYRRDGTPRPLAEKLATVARMIVEDLFPPGLYGLDLGRRLVAEVPSCNMRSLAAARMLALPPAQEDEIVRGELHEAFDQVLKTLTPRQERILRLRFGFDGEVEHTLGEVAERFSITKERVRQIEAAAMRKLRHPSRSRRLRNIVDPPPIETTAVEVEADPEVEVVEAEVPEVVAPKVLEFVLPCGCRCDRPYMTGFDDHGTAVEKWVVVTPEKNPHLADRRVLCVRPGELLTVTPGSTWPVDPHDHDDEADE